MSKQDINTISKIAKAKLSARMMGKKVWDDPEIKAKISAANKGKTHSPETKAKISAAKKGHANITTVFKLGAIMKTVVIYEQFTKPLEFHILDGDYRHLNNIFINSPDDDEKLQDELRNLFCHNKTEHNSFPTDVVKNGAFVIVTGKFPELAP